MSYNTYPQNPFPPNSENAGGGGSPYVLPIASAETLGGVKVGNGLNINENGVLSNPNPTPYTPINYSATEQATGQKWIDGKDIYQKTEVLDTTIQINPTSWTTVVSGANMDKLLSVMTVAGDGTVSDGRLRWKLDSGNVQAAAIDVLNLVTPSITLYYTKTESEV